MTTLDLEAIRQRAEAATSGPWEVQERGDITFIHAPTEYTYVARAATDYPDATQRRQQDRADLEFMAHAREDIPALLAEVDRLRAALRAAGGESK